MIAQSYYFCLVYQVLGVIALELLCVVIACSFMREMVEEIRIIANIKEIKKELEERERKRTPGILKIGLDFDSVHENDLDRNITQDSESETEEMSQTKLKIRKKTVRHSILSKKKKSI